MFWYFVILVLFNLVFLGDLQFRMNVMSVGGGEVGMADISGS